MSLKRYNKMAYDDFEDMVFGHSIYPIKTGFDLEIGAGYTSAEVNYAPRPAAGESKEKLITEYQKITTDVLQRMVQVGFPSVVLETEHVQQMTVNPSWGAEIAHEQKTIMEEFYDEYGIKCALRHTPADIRGGKEALDLRGDSYCLLLESFEEVASNGADMLSIESLGGKSVFDSSIIRNDLSGVLFSIGILGTLDVEFIWEDISKIAKKHDVVAAGDTDCAQANTAMFIAGGLLDRKLAHTLAVVARAVSAPRSLAAYEAGAVGPGKDCGYENTIIKAIAGVPISQEGKGSTCAHSDVMGNLAMQCCDLWSNESVEYRGEFGGTSVQCWGETLSYDCSMMNTAIEAGYAKVFRDVFMVSDRYRDPQAFILAFDNAYRIGESIVKDGNDIYLRAKNAAIEACNIVDEGSRGQLELSRFEKASLAKAIKSLHSLTDEKDVFIEENLNKLSTMESFRPENYGY
ncbi:methanol--5-hydroxybenzimidazolylcobamide Co-methyltransferase [Methanococcoides alaskense]|uniref:Methanol--5-hydroxybenzimidazolylcobamide Co-methyltransferase n=1 Tax=Methanococcoides alaskense TaxID=325778 RepID=A0AA90TZF8_9EURY|nr:methanol--corrinoid protein co-methyltransferase MtaB [Methanococcoides alaskense]MDA0525749.1 methanol--corrinoid protein co-methyltransferase MtaB [Methanococcoides alaskense]MDR6222975.1 methanol--5-hydroxybenzimidazolylcobamide Co-methyltransferase [Methanococcoides alaskense]